MLSQVANFAGENDPCGLYADRLANVEILRVLLLLIIEPAPQNTPPHLIQVRVCLRITVILSTLLYIQGAWDIGGNCSQIPLFCHVPVAEPRDTGTVPN